MPRHTDFTDARLLELIRLAYAAALDERQWPEFLNALPDVFGGTAALLLQHDMIGRGQVNWSSNLEPDELGRYQAYFHQIDPWATSEHARRRAVAGSVLPDEALLSRTELKRTEFFGFVERNEMARVMVSMANRDAELISCLSVYRGERDASFEDGSGAFMRALLPHVAQALRVHNRLTGLVSRMTAAAEALDQLSMAVFFVNGDGRVALMNRSGEHLVAARNGLQFNDGELRAETADATRQLRTAIADARALARDGRLATVSYLTLPRRSDCRPLHVRIVPIDASRRVSALPVPDAAVACLFVTDPGAETAAVRAEALRMFFQLTPAEVRVATRLAEGLTPNEVADVLGLTRNTVRWYVKQICAKVGASTQAQLMRVMQSVAP
ncbi:MAG: hypothetical protein ABS36_02560 [Acidobacteria bacterium SCN 69-37]|nr:MAG: hypothetical protein ABS36_02560 [Acidobacteria bacterium SCN 69-37]